MNGKAPRWPKCSSCGARIDIVTTAKLVSDVKRKHRDELHDQKLDFERRIFKQGALHKRTLAKLAASERREMDRIRRNSEERARQERTLFGQEFSRLKSSYQTHLTQIKDSNDKRNLLNFNELKELIASSVEEGKKIVASVKESNESQMHDLQYWLQQELPRLLIESVNGEKYSDETSDSNPATEVDRLVNEISSRDEVIEKAQWRIKELEGKLAASPRRTLWKRMRRAAPSEPYKEEEAADPQQEILRVIKEIAQEREQLEKSRESYRQRNSGQFTDSFGSTLSKRLVH